MEMRSRQMACAAAAFAAVLLTGPRTAAAPPAATAPAEVIREVAVREIDGAPLDPQYALSFVSVRAGEFVSQVELSRDVRAMLDSRRFSYAGVEVERLPDGVRVVYVVRRRLRFEGPAEVSGARHASADRVREWLNLKDGEYVDDAVLSSHTAKVRDEYRQRHYPDAAVEATVVPVDPTGGVARVRLEIREGTRSKVAGLRFEGNASVPADDLREAAGQPAWWNPKWFFRKRDFDALAREDVRVAVRDVYLNRGYLDAVVDEPRTEPAGRGGVVLVFRVHEGRRYAIGRVTVTGVTLFPTGEVQRAAAGLRPGSPASRRAVQEAARAVRDCYGGRGYVDTSVRSSLEPAADGGTVDVRFDVREGVLARVRSIAIRGNTRTRDKVIRREIGLNPGGILDEVQAERSRRRLENLGYFETVQFFETPVPSDPGLRDLVYEVQEKSTGQFMVGAGFSSVDNLIGFGEITQANFDLLNWPYFSGGGQKARLSVEAGETRTSVDASLTEPWFLDRRLSLTVEGYRRQRNYREFDERREGGAAGLAFPFGPGKLGVRYTFERVRLLDVLQGDFAPPGEYDAIYRFTDERDDYVNGSLRVSWSYDTRNRPFLPTSGIQGSVFGEAGGDWAGGENDIYAAGATYRQWFPLWVGHYLSLRLRAESVDAYGGQDEVGVADRLYLGGGRTVRGFHYRDVGPKVVPVDEAGGRSFHPAGGLTLAAATAEYNVPVVKVLRLALFADAGNVWSDSFDADVGEYAASAGVGLRIDIPGFPIRVDYAWPLRRDDDYTPSDRWVFWIGFD